uniref:General vesicular transport factor p115 n=1 Tax=Macrostomum lignano TaxID=282301 RepID=A0A1I8GCE9_9PLAT
MSLWSYFQASGAGGAGGEAPSGADTVEKLCHRLESSTLIDDRRDALRAIKSLSKKFRLEVGTQAMRLLCDVLEKDRSDPDLCSYSLESLLNIVSCDPQEEAEPGQAELCSQFAEIFVKQSANVHLVLECIDETDSRVRVPALRALAALLESQTKATQEHILTFPQGCGRLIDVLTDQREYVRNLGILLLVHLTRTNTNIQKIIVFEDAFPRLLEIISAEGCSHGGVVVEDCLRILLNLLRSNPPNQTLFRENSYIAQLPVFFEDADSGDEGGAGGSDAEGWSTQRVTNVLQMLSVIRVLVSPQNASQNTRASQRAILQCGLLARLTAILMASGVPAEVLAETINTVAECIRGYEEAQKFLAAVEAPANPPRPAIVVLLISMVNEKQPFPLRLAVLYAFQSYLFRNPDGQAAVVSTLLPASAEATSSITAGQLLCAGLFSSDSHTAWLAAVSLLHAVHGNSVQKEQLLRVQLATGLGSPPVSLLQHCANLLTTNPSARCKLGLLQLLGGWLTQCPLVTKAFLNCASNVNQALAELQGSDHTEEEGLVKALYAYLLGACFLAGHTDLMALVERRVFVKSLKSPQPPSQPSLDYEFSRMFKSAEPEIARALGATGGSGGSGTGGLAQQFTEHEAVVTQYKDLIKEQDSRYRELKTRFDALQAGSEQLTREKASLEETVRSLRDQNTVLKAAASGRSGLAPAVASVAASASTASSSMPSGLDQVGQQTSDSSSSLVQQLRDQLAARETELSHLRAELDTVRKSSPSPAAAGSSGGSVVEAATAYFPDDYDQVKLENAQYRERIAELEEQVAEVAKLSALRDSLQRRIDELLVIEAERDQLRSELAQQQQPEDTQELKQQLDELTSERDNLKSENEDLLVLLSDQDSKLEALREQVKSLGGKVDEEDDEPVDLEEGSDGAEYEDN